MADETKRQHKWCWCLKCEGLFYIGTEWASYCPAGGEHDETFSGDFTYAINLDNKGEAGWRRCVRCQVLFLDTGSLALYPVGPCPAPGKSWLGPYHEADLSVKYFVEKNIISETTLQPGWRYCGKCRGLYYGKNASQGKCPGGGAHDGEGSPNYFLFVE